MQMLSLFWLCSSELQLEEMRELVPGLAEAVESTLRSDFGILASADYSHQMDVMINQVTDSAVSISTLFGRLSQLLIKKSLRRSPAEPEPEPDATSEEPAPSLIGSVLGYSRALASAAYHPVTTTTQAVGYMADKVAAPMMEKTVGFGAEVILPAFLRTSGHGARGTTALALTALPYVLGPIFASLAKLDDTLLGVLLSDRAASRERIAQLVKAKFEGKEGVYATVLEQFSTAKEQCSRTVVLRGNNGFQWSEWAWIAMWHAMPRFLERLAHDVGKMGDDVEANDAVVESWAEAWKEAHDAGIADYHRLFVLRHCSAVREFVLRTVHEPSPCSKVVLTGHGSGGALAASLAKDFDVQAVVFGAVGAVNDDSNTLGSTVTCSSVPDKAHVWNIVDPEGTSHRVGQADWHLCAYDGGKCGKNPAVRLTSMLSFLAKKIAGKGSIADSMVGGAHSMTSTATQWLDAVRCQQSADSWDAMLADVRGTPLSTLECDADRPLSREELEEMVEDLVERIADEEDKKVAPLPPNLCESHEDPGCVVALQVKPESDFVFVTTETVDVTHFGTMYEIEPEFQVTYTGFDMKYVNARGQLRLQAEGAVLRRTHNGGIRPTEIPLVVTGFQLPVGASESIPAVKLRHSDEEKDAGGVPKAYLVFEFTPFSPASKRVTLGLSLRS